jgi:hypothetical protein
VSVVVDALQPLEQLAAGYLVLCAQQLTHMCCSVCVAGARVSVVMDALQPLEQLAATTTGQHNVCSATDNVATCRADVLCLFVPPVRVAVGGGAAAAGHILTLHL